MLDYDEEADRYDETRGGIPRARAAAEAIVGLLPPDLGWVVDIAGGTGIVSACVAASGRRPVLVADRSHGMLAKAVRRVPGRAIRADGTALPLRDGSVGAVTAIWLLHLVPDAEPFVAEAARVLRPGGVFLTTVDKSGTGRADVTDARHRVEALARTYGLEGYGARTFVGHGQRGRPVYTVCGFAKQPGAAPQSAMARRTPS